MTTTESTPSTEPEEPTSAPETPTEAPANPDGADLPHPGTEEPTEADEDTRPGREAARYRRQLRDAEVERDTLRGQVEGFQRASAERIAAKHITEPAGLWAAGVELADLLGEDGSVDDDKVTAAAVDARDRLGLKSKRDGNYVPREGTNPPPPPYPNRFEDALTI